MSSSSYNPNITLTSLSTQQGEINLVTNPIAEFDASNWTTSSATLTRSSTGVLSPVIPTGFTASSTTSTTSYVQTSLLTVPATLRNRKLKVQLYIQCADTATWKVDVLKSDGSTRYTLSTDSSGVSALPALTGTYTTTFDMDTGSGIYVRLTRYAGSGTSTLSFTNLIVGPGIQPQGAAVQEWQSFIPLTNGLGTPTNVQSLYQRVGSSAHVNIRLTTGVPSAVEARIGVPGTVTGFPSATVVGFWERNVSGTGVIKRGALFAVNGFNYLFPTQDDSNQNASPFNALNGNGLFASSEVIAFTTTVPIPIAEWAGSGTVQLAQNDVEYAWNSSTSTTSDTTSFAYGPNGIALQSFAPSGISSVDKRVRFQTPIQPTDIVTIEIMDPTTNFWAPAASRLHTVFSSNDAGTTFYGTDVNDVSGSNTDIDVRFFSRSADKGNAWSILASNGWRWRVRKSSAGAAVGFGIVSSQSAGLFPLSNSNLDDATATRLGLKQYLHGTTYNGGVAPTVSAGANITNIGSVVRAIFIPYQTQDGSWRLRLTVVTSGSTSSSTATHQININGIVFKNVTSFNQALSWSSDFATSYTVCLTNTNTIYIQHPSNVAPTAYSFSGDVELESKPTWAY